MVVLKRLHIVIEFLPGVVLGTVHTIGVHEVAVRIICLAVQSTMRTITTTRITDGTLPKGAFSAVVRVKITTFRCRFYARTVAF